MSENRQLPIPSIEEFKKTVEECQRKYGITDCIYTNCLQEISYVKLESIDVSHEIRIFRPFLLTWGVMNRLLGYQGVTAICNEIKNIAHKIEPIRKENLFMININEFKDLTIELFDEISRIGFKSRKKKWKKVESTTASKVMHLACPDLFIMWDRPIRTLYKLKGDGRNYHSFLQDMQKLWQELSPTIENLQKKYGNKPTRIIDQYNWMRTHPDR